MFQLLVFIIITCYGGGFSCMPAYLSDLFGTKQLSAIHGRILTAWGLAGIAGPLLLSVIYERTLQLQLYTVLLQRLLCSKPAAGGSAQAEGQNCLSFCLKKQFPLKNNFFS